MVFLCSPLRLLAKSLSGGSCRYWHGQFSSWSLSAGTESGIRWRIWQVVPAVNAANLQASAEASQFSVFTLLIPKEEWQVWALFPHHASESCECLWSCRPRDLQGFSTCQPCLNHHSQAAGRAGHCFLSWACVFFLLCSLLSLNPLVWRSSHPSNWSLCARGVFLLCFCVAYCTGEFWFSLISDVVVGYQT